MAKYVYQYVLDGVQAVKNLFTGGSGKNSGNSNSGSNDGIDAVSGAAVSGSGVYATPPTTVATQTQTQTQTQTGSATGGGSSGGGTSGSSSGGGGSGGSSSGGGSSMGGISAGTGNSSNSGNSSVTADGVDAISGAAANPKDITLSKTQEAMNRGWNKSTGSTLGGSSDSGSGGGGGGGSGGGGGGIYYGSPPNFKVLEEELKESLANLDQQIQLAINRGDYNKAMKLQTQAQNQIATLVKTYKQWGYNESTTEVATLLNKGYKYADQQDKLYQNSLDDLIDALKELKEVAEDATKLQEKQQAVDDAQARLQNAQAQRTVRVFNQQSDQWEWVADRVSVENAQATLEKAEAALQKEKLAQELAAVQNAVQHGASADDIEIGEELLALLTDAQQSGGVFTGVGEIGTAGRLTSEAGQAAANEVVASLEASGKLSAVTGSQAGVGGNSMFNSGNAGVDNSVTYNIGDITLSESEARSLTVAELAERLRELSLG